MESTSLAGIKQQLQQEQVEIRSKADKLRCELQGINEDLQRIDAAIAALEGSATATPPSKVVPAKERKRTSNPAASKAAVVQYMEELLTDNGRMSEQELKDAIESRVKEAGYTLMGFSLRFKEAKADSRFATTPEGISLKASPNPGNKSGSKEG